MSELEIQHLKLSECHIIGHSDGDSGLHRLDGVPTANEITALTEQVILNQLLSVGSE